MPDRTSGATKQRYASTLRLTGNSGKSIDYLWTCVGTARRTGEAIRLLFAQEEQRESETPCQICASEEIRLTIFECPLCGEPGLLPEVNALALDYITELERRTA